MAGTSDLTRYPALLKTKAKKRAEREAELTANPRPSLSQGKAIGLPNALVGKLAQKSYLFKSHHSSFCDLLIFFGDGEHFGLRAQIAHLGGQFANSAARSNQCLGALKRTALRVPLKTRS